MPRRKKTKVDAILSAFRNSRRRVILGEYILSDLIATIALIGILVAMVYYM
jgi:hypothetical protein